MLSRHQQTTIRTSARKKDDAKLTDGQITRPYGPSFWVNGSRFSCSRQNMRIGSTNTIVLPEPVNAMPIMSRPDRLQQHTCQFINRHTHQCDPLQRPFYTRTWVSLLPMVMHLSFLCILSAEIKTFYTLLNILHHLTDVSRWTWVSWFHHQFSSCICSRAEPRHWVCKPAYLMPLPIQDKWEGCGRNSIGRKNGGIMEVGCWLVQMEWHLDGQCDCLSLSSPAP